MDAPPFNLLGDTSEGIRNRYAMKGKHHIWEIVKKQIVGRHGVCRN